MKRTVSYQKGIISLFCLLAISLLLVQCKKDGVNATSVSRALVNTPDSTIFSPFYDSTVVPYADATPGVNDVVVTKSVMSIIKNNCVSSSCHGGNGVKPYLNTYASVKSMVVPNNPVASHLYQLITTSDLNQAMPPINYGVDLTVTEKSIIYNWIKNGAKEYPALEDYRPAGVALITTGCTSGNCHNQATATGSWAKSGYLGTLTSADTVSFIFQNQTSGSLTYYTQLKDPKLSSVWSAYKDSVRKFYADTLGNASFRIWKVFGTRGPLNTYDDLIFDASYPKTFRSAANAYSVNGVKVNCKGDYLGSSSTANNYSTSTLLSRCDSTIVSAPPRTKSFNPAQQGGMAYSDGGLRPSDIAIIKGWYFSDPNIPDVWKFGMDGTGIFKYRKTGKIITK
jgi:hypothetical protein